MWSPWIRWRLIQLARPADTAIMAELNAAGARALARACSRMGDRALVGLLPGGQKAGRAWCQGALASGLGGFLGSWSFWKQWQFISIIIKQL